MIKKIIKALLNQSSKHNYKYGSSSDIYKHHKHYHQSHMGHGYYKKRKKSSGFFSGSSFFSS